MQDNLIIIYNSNKLWNKCVYDIHVANPFEYNNFIINLSIIPLIINNSYNINQMFIKWGLCLSEKAKYNLNLNLRKLELSEITCPRYSV